MAERVRVHTPDPVRVTVRPGPDGRLVYHAGDRRIGDMPGDACDLERLERTGALSAPRHIGLSATVSGGQVYGTLFALIPPSSPAGTTSPGDADAKATPLLGLRPIHYPIGELSMGVPDASDALEAASWALASHLGLEIAESAESRAIRELLASI